MRIAEYGTLSEYMPIKLVADVPQDYSATGVMCGAIFGQEFTRFAGCRDCPCPISVTDNP